MFSLIRLLTSGGKTINRLKDCRVYIIFFYSIHSDGIRDPPSCRFPVEVTLHLPFAVKLQMAHTAACRLAELVPVVTVRRSV